MQPRLRHSKPDLVVHLNPQRILLRSGDGCQCGHSCKLHPAAEGQPVTSSASLGTMPPQGT